MNPYARALLAQAEALEATARTLRELVAQSQGPVLQPVPPPQDQFISVSRALQIAGLPAATPEDAKRSRRRLIGWSRGAPWASRPNGRTVVINEQRFLAYLRSRQGRAA